jgi:hypothetical protein
VRERESESESESEGGREMCVSESITAKLRDEGQL